MTTVRRRAAAALLTVVAAVVPLATPGQPAARAADATVVRSGYLEAADGTRLKWTAHLPSASGEFPVLLQYDGYNAGSNPTRVNPDFAAEMLADGYAVLGVSVRGTACSGGRFDLFSPKWATDGKTAVEWAARQPWSTGKVGMFSFSYAGITQLLTAAERPQGLAAVAPGMVVSDMYRDVGYPGGITNLQFPAVWEAALHLSWAQAAQQAESSNDPECLTNVAANQALGIPGGVGVSGLQHPYDDRYMRSRSPERGLGRIDVPVLGEMAWQDEQTGPRGGLAFERTDPKRTWVVGTNGMHGMYAASPDSRRLLHAFFDRYLKGERNGWARTPHLQLWHEALVDGYRPSWVSRFPDGTADTRVRRLYLGPDGRLGGRPPGRTGSTPYVSGLPSPGVVSEQVAVDQSTAYGLTWQVMPVDPAGSAAFTTRRLGSDLTLAGSASLDLWVRSTIPDTDVQVTITEVRPDGREMYVQRGWLRLSHRALDRRRSTPNRPVHPHTIAAQRDLPVGKAVPARVEVLPFVHTFRAGSRLRVWLDSPSQTGLWGFGPSAPAPIEVVHGPKRPSRLVVAELDDGDARTPLPGCGQVASQPCRPDPLAAG